MTLQTTAAAAVVASYIALSVFATRHPKGISLLHGKAKCRIPFSVANTAHRGGGQEVPENTMYAFRHARKAKASLIELDVRVTKDNKLVVFHDETLARRTVTEVPSESLVLGEGNVLLNPQGAQGFNKSTIEELNYDELPLLSIDPSQQNADPMLAKQASHRYENKANDGQVANDNDARRIPLLSEVFEAFPDTAIMIDIKSSATTVVDQCDAMIRQYKREHLTVWGCYRHKEVDERCRKVNPNIPIFYTARQLFLTYLLYWSGLLPFVPAFADMFSVPALPRFISPGLFAHLKARGVVVLVWGRAKDLSKVNTKQGWDMLWDAGVDGICTDVPEAHQSYLDKLNRKI